MRQIIWYSGGGLLPFEHRSKLVGSLAEAKPPRVAELAKALVMERDPALRKRIVQGLLTATGAQNLSDLLRRLEPHLSPIPTEEDMREVLGWRLPY